MNEKSHCNININEATTVTTVTSSSLVGVFPENNHQRVGVTNFDRNNSGMCVNISESVYLNQTMKLFAVVVDN